MSSRIIPSQNVVQVNDLEQEYILYSSPSGMLLDLLGFEKILFWKRRKAPTFKALSGVSFTIRKGERVGIIGRNGAGKTTLLKLITGNFRPSNGTLVVNGKIQSLMDQGVGFHPEFTGRQNIRSALIYNGIEGKDLKDCETDIQEFVELGEFIDQPLKTYSLGMKARLGFAAATAIRPDILIVDEVLGAGDQYFAFKSALRMKKLTGEGVSLILVSHSNSQILQFCERAIWLDAGKIVADGPALEVVKAYDAYIMELENKKLAEDSNANAKRQVGILRATLDPGGKIPESRWAGTGKLLVEDVRVEVGGKPTWVLRTGEGADIRVRVKSVTGNSERLTLNIYFFTMDGRPVASLTSDEFYVESTAGAISDFVLSLTPLLFGNGDYVFSVGLYQYLDYGNLGATIFHDLVDRSYQVKIRAKHDADVSLIHPPAIWTRIMDGKV